MCLIFTGALNVSNPTPQSAARDPEPPRLGQHYLSHALIQGNQLHPWLHYGHHGLSFSLLWCSDCTKLMAPTLQVTFWISFGTHLGILSNCKWKVFLSSTSLLLDTYWSPLLGLMTSPLFTQHLSNWVVAICIGSRDTRALFYIDLVSTLMEFII